MNIIKILIASFVFPFLNYRQTLNAITVPLFIYTINWALGYSLAADVAGIGWLSLVIQLFALTMLLINCNAILLGQKQPKLNIDFELYLKVMSFVIVGCIASYILKYLLIIFVLGSASQESVNTYQVIVQIVSNIALYWAILIVPHYMETGSNSFSKLLSLSRSSMLSFFSVAIGFQVIQYLLKTPLYLIGDEAASLLNVFVSYFAYVVGSNVIGFFYLQIKNKSVRI